MSISKVVIPEFQIYKATTIKSSAADFSPSKLKDAKKVYYAQLDDNFEITTFYHFPLLILPDSELWNHANSYFLHKLESINLPHSSTLSSIADSLKSYGNYCLSSEIDYLTCKRKSSSPLRRYRRYLSDRIMLGELSASTAKSHISNVVNFYRYLIHIENIQFEFPPWHERESQILISDTGRGGYIKTVTTSDVSQAIKGRISTQKKREHCTYEGRIIDGGDLRPLNDKEQDILVRALKGLNHPEMTLIFIIALCTGARLQTILTLRYDSFMLEPSEGAQEVPVYAGRYNKNGNGLVDSKGDKSITIYFPLELYKKVQLYLNSERAVKRHNKCAHKLNNKDFQYVFLSQQGNPFYISKSDINVKYYKQVPSGQAVTTFVCERLKPKLIELGFTGSFKFHDTRATFGMNMVNKGLSMIDKNDNAGQTIDQLFRLVKVRMCHSELSTTQQYLDFNQNNKVVKDAKSGWEQYLKNILDIVDA